VSGKIVEENEHVKIGQHHTLDLELHRPFVLRKAEGWDSVALEQLKEAIREDRRAELWAVVMGEGIANICMITEYRTILRHRIDIPVPRKRKSYNTGHSKAMEKFFMTTLATLRRQMDPGNPSTAEPEKTLPLLLASPGFVAQAFFTYMKEEATRTLDKSLRALIASVIIAPATSAHAHALSDILSSPAITTKLSDTKYARETALMDKFTDLMRLDEARAWYGPREVERAVDRGGVGRGGGVLMISDTLFRSHNVEERRRWVALVDRVREVEGGEVRVFSSLHESGKRLEGLGNIAAILTYPIDDLEEDETFVVEDGEEGEMVI
jgi:protein pelota